MPLAGIGGMLAFSSHGSGLRELKNSRVARAGAVPTPLMTTTGWSFILISRGISPPRPKWSISVMEAARVAATPASTALPPCSRICVPAATSWLLPAPSMK
jgi:hypothetical protein